MSEQFENLVNSVLTQNPDIPLEQLLSMIEKKKKESHGLLSDEGAIRLLAQQLSIDLTSTKTNDDQRIVSLRAGLMDASITGTVVSVGALAEFTRQDGSMGRVLRLLLGDSTGRVACVAWDEIAAFLNSQKLAAGLKVRLEHGYTKYGRAGETEFHLGSKSNIQVLSGPPTLREHSGPIRISSLARAIGELPAIRLRMRKLQAGRTEKGPVQALCEDETGLVIVKFWDETGDTASAIGEGKTIMIEKSYAAERNGLIYVNVGHESTVLRSDEPQIESPSPVPINTLSPEPILQFIAGKIVERSDAKEIETKGGRRARVSNIRVEDETGRIRVSLWDRHAELVSNVQLGDFVELAGVRIRRGFMDQLEASTVFLSQIARSQLA